MLLYGVRIVVIFFFHSHHILIAFFFGFVIIVSRTRTSLTQTHLFGWTFCLYRWNSVIYTTKKCAVLLTFSGFIGNDFIAIHVPKAMFCRFCLCVNKRTLRFMLAPLWVCLNIKSDLWFSFSFISALVFLFSPSLTYTHIQFHAISFKSHQRTNFFRF